MNIKLPNITIQAIVTNFGSHNVKIHMPSNMFADRIFTGKKTTSKRHHTFILGEIYVEGYWGQETIEQL